MKSTGCSITDEIAWQASSSQFDPGNCTTPNFIFGVSFGQFYHTRTCVVGGASAIEVSDFGGTEGATCRALTKTTDGAKGPQFALPKRKRATGAGGTLRIFCVRYVSSGEAWEISFAMRVARH